VSDDCLRNQDDLLGVALPGSQGCNIQERMPKSRHASVQSVPEHESSLALSHWWRKGTGEVSPLAGLNYLVHYFVHYLIRYLVRNYLAVHFVARRTRDGAKARNLSIASSSLTRQGRSNHGTKKGQ
jgi:hypothetical protein